jgi:chaperonin cofactor prefoldin
MRTYCLGLFVALAPGAFACSSAGLQHRVSSDLVGAIPKDGRAPVEQKAQHLEHTREALDTALRELTAARVELERSETDHSITEERIDASRTRLDMAQEGKLTALAEHEGRLGAALEALAEAHEEEVAWREAGVAYASTQVELARRRVLLAEAELEAAKADAVSKAPIEGKESVVLSAYQAQVSEQLAETAALQQQSSEQWTEVKEAEQLCKEAFGRVPKEVATIKADDLAKERTDHERSKATITVLKERISLLEASKRALEERLRRAETKLTQAPTEAPAEEAN